MACTPRTCSVSIKNMGSDCAPQFMVVKKLIVVKKYDNDGNLNGIPFADTLNKAYFDALVNQADTSKRWYPVPEMKNIENVREESIYQTFNDGSKIFIQSGSRSFVGYVTSLAGLGAATPQMLGKLKSLTSAEIGVYMIDANNNIIGQISEDGTELLPISIDSQSFSANLVLSTDTETQMLLVNFVIDSLVNDEDWRAIECSEHGTDILALRGLIDVCAEVLDATPTTIKVKLYNEFGTPKNPGVDIGLLLANFTLYNNTDAAPVIISSVVESPKGTYLITFPAQTIGDELKLTPSKSGRDYTCVVNAPIITGS